MDSPTFQRVLRRTLAIPVLLLAGLAAILLFETSVLLADIRWVDHTDQVLSEARQLTDLITGQESSLRAYLLTRNPAFLQSYVQAKAETPRRFAELQRLTGDNSQQSALLSSLQHTQDEWQAFAGRMIRHSQRGANVVSSAANLTGVRLMEQIRGLQRRFLDGEEQLRDQRRRRAARAATFVIVSGLACSVFIALVISFYTRRQLLTLSLTYDRHLQAERLRTEQLRESRGWLSATLRSIGDAVIAADDQGKVTFLNRAAENLLEWTEQDAKGHSLDEVLATAENQDRPFPRLMADIRTGTANTVLSGQSRVLTRRGVPITIDAATAPIRNEEGSIEGVVVSFHDIGERLRTEETLRSSEKLAIIGRLTGTVAHEIRNPLEAVKNLLYMAEQDHSLSRVARDYIHMADEELDRVTQIAQELLGFYRESRSPLSISPGEIVESVSRLFAKKMETCRIQFEHRVEPHPRVLGYPGELRQVFSNLIGNSIEAIGSNGRITVHTYRSVNPNDPRQQGTRVVVLDNGPGISYEVQRRLFTPFFTTKGEQGTGLGLWLSRGLIEKQGGTIFVRSSRRNANHGTAFSIFLPQANHVPMQQRVA